MLQRESELKDIEIRLSREEADLKQNEARLRRDTLLLKDAFENRAMDRKEVIEIMKYIPILLTGIGAIYVAIKKLKG